MRWKAPIIVLLLVLLVPCLQAQEATEPAGSEWEKPLPVTFSLDYTLVSDYIFRGINFSEYPGEGREKPNHQLAVGAELDAGEFGRFGGCVWFEWFAAQDQLTPAYDGNNQEVDYALYWAYDIEALATTFETGWIAYTFPPFSGDGHDTYEWYFSLSFDDSVLFGTESSVLNPYFAFYYDFDLADGIWMEVGISHDFTLSDLGMENTPVLKDITVSPSLVLGIDHRYMDGILATGSEGTTKLANLNYGLAVNYDISSAFDIHQQYGRAGVTGFLNFSQALRDELINDEFYGGVTLSYAW